MPTPDSIDRPKGGTTTAPPNSTIPGATPWEILFGQTDGPIEVYVNPVTRQVVRPTSPTQIPDLVGSGYVKATVDQSKWGDFVRGLGPNFKLLAPGETSKDIIPPTQAPLSPEDLAQLQASAGYTNDQAGAGQHNLRASYDISQAGRDRAAVTTKENYKATEQPTLASAAFSGAGYHQALGDLLMGRVNRDRTLAGLADEQTAAQFQFSLASQQLEQQRVAQLQQLYSSALGRSQSAYDQGIDSIFSWVFK